MSDNLKRIRSNLKVLIWMLALSYVLYSFFINNNLVNTYDGLWRGNSHFANEWEISIGRFFIPVLSTIRLGIAIEPVISLLSLFYICLGLYLILIMFNMVNKIGVLLSLLTISSSTVCIWLSYRYMSTVFSLAFLFAVIASYILIMYKDTNTIQHIFKIVFSTIFIVLSLSLYQAQLSVTLLIVMVNFVICLIEDKSKPIIFSLKPLIDLFISVIIGMVIYKCLWDFALKFLNLSASSYGGANNLNFLEMLYNIPNKLIKSFTNFKLYYTGELIKHCGLNLYNVGIILITIFIVGIFYVMVIKKISPLKIFFVTIDLALIPSALSLSTFLAVDSAILPQGTIAFAILFTIIGVLVFNLFDFSIYRKQLIVFILFFLIILHGRLNQLMIDTFAMYDHRNASINLMNQVLNRIDFIYNNNADLEISPTNNVVFLGIPLKNELFKVTAHNFRRLSDRDCINNFAKVGYFLGNNEKKFDCLQFSYEGLIDKFMNLNYVADFEKYIKFSYLYKDDNFRNIKPFPSNESIFTLDGSIIVKISD